MLISTLATLPPMTKTGFRSCEQTISQLQQLSLKRQ